MMHKSINACQQWWIDSWWNRLICWVNRLTNILHQRLWNWVTFHLGSTYQVKCTKRVLLWYIHVSNTRKYRVLQVVSPICISSIQTFNHMSHLTFEEHVCPITECIVEGNDEDFEICIPDTLKIHWGGFKHFLKQILIQSNPKLCIQNKTLILLNKF